MKSPSTNNCKQTAPGILVLLSLTIILIFTSDTGRAAAVETAPSNETAVAKASDATAATSPAPVIADSFWTRR